MCVAVYAAAPNPLPRVGWLEAAPAFYAEPAENDDAVRKQLLDLYVVYLGSHEGCGCGFCLDGHEGDEDWQLRRTSLRAMADYISEASTVSVVRVWIGWEGEQAKAPDSTIELSAARAREPDSWSPLLSDAYSRSHLVTIPGGRSRIGDPKVKVV